MFVGRFQLMSVLVQLPMQLKDNQRFLSKCKHVFVTQLKGVNKVYDWILLEDEAAY